MNILEYNNDIFIKEKTIIIMGNFDGVHKGHRKLIKNAINTANKISLKSVIITFNYDDCSNKNREFIITKKQKQTIFKNLGIDTVIYLNFEDIRNMTGKEFIEKILIEKLSMSVFCCSENHIIGKDRINIKDIENILIKNNKSIQVDTLDIYENENISSTRIRTAIKDGKIKEVNDMLSYNYGWKLPVVSGKQLGRKLGFPTINQIPSEKMVKLPNAVYASKVLYENIWHTGITNIGVRPTVDGENLVFETYIIDKNFDLYNEEISVAILFKIRDEKTFDNIIKLKEAVLNDIKYVKDILK